jgi:hypothetical protein
MAGAMLFRRLREALTLMYATGKAWELPETLLVDPVTDGATCFSGDHPRIQAPVGRRKSMAPGGLSSDRSLKPKRAKACSRAFARFGFSLAPLRS